MTEPLSTPSPIRIEQEGELTLVTVKPVQANAEWVVPEEATERLTEQMQQQPHPKCVIDLSDLNYLGSMQVAFIVRIWKWIRGVEGGVAVVCPHPVVRDVLALAGLDKVLTVLPTRAAAEANLTPPRKGGSPVFTGLLVAGAALGAVIAAAGAGLIAVQATSEPELVRTIASAGVAVGFICGLILTCITRGRSRWIGLAAAVITFAIALASQISHFGR